MVVRTAQSARTVWRRSPAAPMPAEGESGGVTGTSHGFGDDDVCAVKLDAAGAIEWQQLLDGSQSDYWCEIEPTARAARATST